MKYNMAWVLLVAVYFYGTTVQGAKSSKSCLITCKARSCQIWGEELKKEKNKRKKAEIVARIQRCIDACTDLDIDSAEKNKSACEEVLNQDSKTSQNNHHKKDPSHLKSHPKKVEQEDDSDTSDNADDSQQQGKDQEDSQDDGNGEENTQNEESGEEKPAKSLDQEESSEEESTEKETTQEEPTEKESAEEEPDKEEPAEEGDGEETTQEDESNGEETSEEEAPSEESDEND